MMKNMNLQLFILLVLFCSISYSTDACADKDSEKCAGWAKNGFCTNCFYSCEDRIKYCAKTCEYCDGQKTCQNCTVTTTIAPTPTTSINCVDYGDFCKSWAAKGYCTNCFYKCSDRMKYCPKTCGFCTPGACQDCQDGKSFMSLFGKHNSLHLN